MDVPNLNIYAHWRHLRGGWWTIAHLSCLVARPCYTRKLQRQVQPPIMCLPKPALAAYLLLGLCKEHAHGKTPTCK